MCPLSLDGCDDGVIVLPGNDIYTVPQRIETGVVLLLVLFLSKTRSANPSFFLSF
jgi:hypothetical protein